MSGYEPVVGDRVRVTYEGVVRVVCPDDYFDVDGVMFGFEDPNVSVEKVAPPLPTTPGSVVRGIPGTPGHQGMLFLTDDGWLRDDGWDLKFPDLEARFFDVIFDAATS